MSRVLCGPHWDGPASGENISHLCRLRVFSEVFSTAEWRQRGVKAGAKASGAALSGSDIDLRQRAGEREGGRQEDRERERERVSASVIEREGERERQRERDRERARA